jgi:hypothetical protein
LIGIVQSSGFINVFSWWSAWKESLPGHYQMAMDYHGTPTTSMPSERILKVPANRAQATATLG